MRIRKSQKHESSEPHVVFSDLEGERSDSLPHVEGLSDRSLGVLLSHFRGEVRYAVEKQKQSIKHCNQAQYMNKTTGASIPHQNCKSDGRTPCKPRILTSDTAASHDFYNLPETDNLTFMQQLARCVEVWK